MNQNVQNDTRCGSPSTQQSTRPVYRPAVDIIESKDAVRLLVNLPGVAEDNLDITVDQDSLEIRGKVDPPGYEGLAPVRSE